MIVSAYDVSGGVDGELCVNMVCLGLVIGESQLTGSLSLAGGRPLVRPHAAGDQTCSLVTTSRQIFVRKYFYTL